MTHHLTAEMIAETLDAQGVLLSVQPAEGWGCGVAFVHKGDSELSATLYDDDDDTDIECRTFRIVEVES